jgi:hypothetical protein
MAKKSSRKRSPIPEELEAKLLVESRNTCNICWKSKEVQIHHIIPVEFGGDNSEDNLIVVCLNCHSDVHTQRDMARNLKPRTIRLYKETWLDLLARYPLVPANLADEQNDLRTIREILQQGHRRGLYFPFHLETPQAMFHSLDEFRLYLQRCGYKLLVDTGAREHAGELYKALLEISFFDPGSRDSGFCMHGMFGREDLALLELKCKKARFHVNELSKLAGYKEEIISDDEFNRMRLDVYRGRDHSKHCFAHFTPDNPECAACEFRGECIELSA